MVKKSLIIVAALFAAVFAYYYFFATDEAKIRQEFKQLAKWASKEAHDTTMAIAAKINNIKLLFDEECLFVVQANDSRHKLTRQDISSRLFAMLSHNAAVDLSFYDLFIVFPDAQTARINATADLKIRQPNSEATFETHEIECVMIKQDDLWVFSEITIIDVLQR